MSHSGSVFEANFIDRTYPSVINDYNVAFAELIANSWDSGATRVDIKIPKNIGEEIVIEDNGSGMTDNEFRSRWMVISYDRVSHQGNFVEYPSDRGPIKRIAYGRNGAGRHGLLCFNDNYFINTYKEGKCNTYHVFKDSGHSAISIEEYSQEICDNNKHGTKLIVLANKKLPQIEDVRSTLKYKFLFDPEFEIYINNSKIEFFDIIGIEKKITYKIKDASIDISVVEVPEGEKNTAANGIAFWISKRLVGKPSWSLNDISLEDGRRKFARRHLFIVQSNDFINDIIFDWSGFYKTEMTIDLYNKVRNYVCKYRRDYYRDKTDEVKKDVIKQNIEDVEELSESSKYELRSFFDQYLEQKPDIDFEELNTIIKSMINVFKSRNGASLINKLSNMSTDEISILDNILADWSIYDIRCVLDEIDNRLKVIEAIDKLRSEKTTDELHTLHPLITQARWLFGPEFDTPQYTFNKSLTTVVEKFIKGKKKKHTTINWSKRPDLVISSDFSLAATCIEAFDRNEIAQIEKILIIELKKGSFTIKQEEMNQAESYANAIYYGDEINSNPNIKVYVVGDKVDKSMSNYKELGKPTFGEISAYTYSELVRTAEKRLFNLRTRLKERYDEVNPEDYLSDILKEPKQLKISS